MNRTALISTFLVVVLVGTGVVFWLLGPTTRSTVAMPPLDGWMQQFTLNDPPLPVPDTAVRNGDGQPVRLADFKGRVVLVNFWATWCAPCIREMPSLDRLQAAMGGNGFTVFAVNEDRNGAKVAAPFLEKLGVKNLGINLDDKMAFARSLGVRGLPASFLVDRNGRIVGALHGLAEWDSDEAKALIRFYMERS
ncbi:MAG: TlpA family protein disulfide reductase [Alphaproteobacteria bacterium]|nr:TlpA family protein disulfide reductase [Alphaproteobacteria bacterium]